TRAASSKPPRPTIAQRIPRPWRGQEPFCGSVRDPRRSNDPDTALGWLKDSGNPSLHARLVGGVFGAEESFEPLLVEQRAALEPEGAGDQKDQREPRPEGPRKAREEDQVPEIHRIARPAIRALRNDPLGRPVHAGTAAGTRQPIPPHQPVLQVAP